MVSVVTSIPADAFEQVLVSEYTKGTPIGWHRDRSHYDQVVGVSLLSAANLRLRRQLENRYLRVSKIVEPRSAYILAGAARSVWEHSIPEVAALRYSVTFRTMVRV
jgi:alkylated DNA repair dioxygenase AlkB